MADYQNAELKLVNLGLQIVLPPELVPQGQYTRLVNVRTLKEGQMATRNGFDDLDYDLEGYGAVRYMTALSDEVLLFVMETGDVLYGQNGEIEVVTIPEEIRELGQARGIPRIPLKLVEEYVTTSSGREPIEPQVKVDNISSVKFTSPFSGDDWTYLATEIGMYKIQVIDGGQDQPSTATAFRWGIRPPLDLDYTSPTEFVFNPAPLEADIVDCPTAVDPDDPDGAANCDCGLDTSCPTCIAYEWVYTYYSSYTGSESGPSAFMEEVTGIERKGTCCPCPTPAIRQTVKLSGFVPSSDPQVDRIRLYRRGGILNEFMLEEELPWNVETYTTWKYDTIIALIGIFLDLDRDVPFTTVEPPVLEGSGLEPGEIPAEGAAPVDEGTEVGIQTATALFETPLPWAWGPYAGRYIFACGDKERPGVVYWTKGTPAPDNAGEIYAIQVSSSAEPLVNGFIFGGECYVWTAEKLFALDWNGFGSAPEFTPREINLSMGISSPKAFTTSPQGVFFLSKDGIFRTDCASFADPITKESLRPIFLGKEAYGLYPVDWNRSNEIQMTVVSQEFHFLYFDINGERNELIYDIQHSRWQQFKLAWEQEKFPRRRGANDPGIIRYSGSEYVLELKNQPKYTYLIAQDGRILKNTEANTGDETEIPDVYYTTPVNIRTGSNDMNSPLSYKEFGVALFDLESPPSSPIRITPYYEGERIKGEQIDILTEGRQTISRSLGDVYARNIAYDFEWDGPGIVHRVVTMWRQDEEGIVHWEHPETSFGIPGWKHMRDGYFGLRSIADVTLTVRVDGEDYVYNLPSTDGERRKVYVKFKPVKGKMYRFFLDCSEPFRTYSDDTYLYLKQWHTGNTYRPTPIGGQGGAF
jgi:hypothetical protein